jgi:hypothetical protein
MRKPRGGYNRHDRGLNQNNVDFTDWTPKIDLEDEFYGGFRPTKKDFSARSRQDGRYCSDGEFFRSGRGPKGWAAETASGLVDGQTPETYTYLISRGRWPKWRKIPPQHAKGNQVNFPFAHQAIRQAEQWLPVVNPERDAAEDLDRWARHLEWLASLGIITDPTDRPFTPSAILHEERAQFYAQHTQRRIQALYLRGFKPSKKLELKRMPVLERVKKNPRLTRDYLARELSHVRAARHAGAAEAVAGFPCQGWKNSTLPARNGGGEGRQGKGPEGCAAHCGA